MSISQKLHFVKITHFGLFLCSLSVSLIPTSEISQDRIDDYHSQKFSNTRCANNAEQQPCFDNTVQTKFTVDRNSDAHLTCIIYGAIPHLVIWQDDKTGFPISMGTNLFLSTPHYLISSPAAHMWVLTIQKAQLNDSGTYSCQLNTHKPISKKFYLDVVPERYQVDVPNPTKLVTGLPKQGIVLEGSDVAFYGQSASLKCTAYYSSLDAKRDPFAHIEWYLNGVAQNTAFDRYITITTRWLEGNILESTLIISRILREHAGQWICLKKPSRKMESQRIDLAVIGLPRQNILRERDKSNVRSISSRALGQQKALYRADSSLLGPLNIYVIAILSLFITLEAQF